MEILIVNLLSCKWLIWFSWTMHSKNKNLFWNLQHLYGQRKIYFNYKANLNKIICSLHRIISGQNQNLNWVFSLWSALLNDSIYKTSSFVFTRDWLTCLVGSWINHQGSCFCSGWVLNLAILLKLLICINRHPLEKNLFFQNL